MNEPATQQPDGTPKPRFRITPTMMAFFFVAVFAVIVLWAGVFSGNDDATSADSTAETTTTTTYESKSALPTDQDMVDACHDALETRMAGNRATRGEVMWNTATVASSAKYRGYYDVTGTGTLDDVIQTPFAFTCLVDFGPPTVAVDNGFTLNP